MRGRVDAIIAENNVLRYTLKLMHLEHEVVHAGNLEQLPPALSRIYIAFSPHNQKSASYAKILSDGWKEIRKSGELKKILAKYNVEDWK